MFMFLHALAFLAMGLFGAYFGDTGSVGAGYSGSAHAEIQQGNDGGGTMPGDGGGSGHSGNGG
jgi:hypothetical protein